MRWTDYVQPVQPAQPAPVLSTSQVPVQAQQHSQQPQELNQGRAGGARKVGFFGAKKTAETALADVERLQRILDERGLLEFDQIRASRDELRRTVESERREWATENQRMQSQVQALRSELAEAEGELVTARASASLQEVGVFDFDHPAEHSAHLAARLDSVRAQYKEMARAKEAIHATSNFLVNVGRGEVIDQDALIDALREGRIAGAGLDVYDKEPLDAGSELLTMEHVVCTPHMAGVGWENVQRRIETVWENFDAVLRGDTPRGVVTTAKKAVAWANDH